MKKPILLLACCFFGKSMFCQTAPAVVSYRGIDSFFIGDPISKYHQSLEVVKGAENMMEGKDKKMYHTYLYSRPGFRPATIPVSIEGISFAAIFLNFLGDSVLTSVNISKLYSKRTDSSYTELKADRDYAIITDYLDNKLNKIGAAKNYSTYKSFIYKGYEWEEGDTIVTLSIQYSLPNTNNTKFITIDCKSKSQAVY